MTLKIHGIIPPVATPMQANEDLDLPRLKWFLDHLMPDRAVYNVPAAVRVCGRLEVRVIERSLREVLHRHEVLRTGIATHRGMPRQEIAPPGEFPLPLVDLEREEELA